MDECKSSLSLKKSSKPKKKSGGLFSMFAGFGGGSAAKESKQEKQRKISPPKMKKEQFQCEMMMDAMDDLEDECMDMMASESLGCAMTP